MRNSKLASSLFVVALTTAGCASGPTAVKEDKVAAAKSQAYTEGVGVVTAGSRGGSGASCSVPNVGLKGSGAQGVGQGPSKDWKGLIGRANTCVSEKNWTTLENLANEMAKADIDSPWGAYYLSVAAEAKGDFPRAIWMVDLAQKKAGGKSGLFMYQRGRVWLRMKETGKAVADIQKAVALEPRLAEGHVFLGEIFSRDQEPDKALSHFRAALEKDAKNYRALTGLAESLLTRSSGNAGEAATLYSRALEINPGQIQSWMRLAFIYESLQKNNELALNTYQGLKNKMDSGSIKEKLDFDLNAKIKTLEDSVKATRMPAAQASSKNVDEKRSVK